MKLTAWDVLSRFLDGPLVMSFSMAMLDHHHFHVGLAMKTGEILVIEFEAVRWEMAGYQNLVMKWGEERDVTVLGTAAMTPGPITAGKAETRQTWGSTSTEDWE